MLIDRSILVSQDVALHETGAEMPEGGQIPRFQNYEYPAMDDECRDSKKM